MIGSTLSHYLITAELGRGGMGVVYEATDQSLKRQIALKILPPETASDPVRLERFRREAEVVAGLSHPNIVSIHSIEEAGGVHFLTMELIDGEPLDAALRRGGLPLAQVLRIGQSVAEALVRAHERKVVHRDLKPANVMLTRDGHVKVLDFGLAKLAVDPESTGEQGTQLMTEPALTEAGTVLGTVAYMSPEQAQSLQVDHRSDIFSLGCILYEAATGTPPFRGESAIDTLHQLIHDDPRPVEELAPQAPHQLRWVLRKALAKKPAARYQSARELAIDIGNLRRDLDSGESRPGATSSTGSFTVHKPWRPKPHLIAWAAAALAVVAGLWWFSQRASPEREAAVPSPAAISVRSLTSSGRVTCAAISPDGNYLAYVYSYQGEQSLNLREVDGPRDVELIPPRQVGYWDLTFTRDGAGIVFGEKSRDEPAGAFYRISTLGGAAKRLLSGIDSPPTFSPDGGRMAWVRARYPAVKESSLMVADADGSGVGALASVQHPERLAGIFYTGPSWSPDGARIAATVVTAPRKSEIRAFSATTGGVEWTASQPWDWAARVAWLPEGDGLLVIAQSAADAGPMLFRARGQVWFVPYPLGEPVRLTNDLLDYRVLSLSSDGRRLVTVAQSNRSEIFVMPRDGSGPPRKISRSTVDGRFGLDFLTDGRIVYQTLDGRGTAQIAIINSDGSGYRQLTEEEGSCTDPHVTPEGRIVYFTHTNDGEEIWATDPNGDDRRLIAALPRDAGSFSLSPDGRWVVYSARTEGELRLWRAPLNGGAPERLTDFEATHGVVSPDNARIAFYYEDPGSGVSRIGVMPFAPGRPQMQLDFVRPFWGSLLQWAEDGGALLVSSAPRDRANLWRLPLDGGKPERLTDFDDLRLFDVAFSKNGESVAFARGQALRDAVLMEGFR